MRLPWLGKETDNASFDFSRSGWRIPQLHEWDVYSDPSKEHADLINFRTRAILREMAANPNQRPAIRPVSKALYNCVGMIFCSRRAHVDIENIYDILWHDGYNPIEKADLVAGDLVLYTFQSEPSHIGVASCISYYEGRAVRVSVLSKWGKAGEVEHDYMHVPKHCGIPSSYYTTRVRHEA